MPTTESHPDFRAGMIAPVAAESPRFDDTGAPGLFARVWSELGEDSRFLVRADFSAGAVPLVSRLPVSPLAEASVAAASLSAAVAAASIGGASETSLKPGDVPQVTVDPSRIATAYTSDRHFRVNGEKIGAWSPLSGFWQSSDGWVRTHANYPNHAAALRRGLALHPDAGGSEVATAIARMSSEVAAARITGAGGMCVTVNREDPENESSLVASPLLRVARIGSGAPGRAFAGPHQAPLRGIRVLDLTRVIAGPVAARTLALFGAEVLRIDSPRVPEIEWQHLDTGHGKHSALLDITSPSGRERLERLLSGADVALFGYRPLALERLGLSPAIVARRHPGIVVARLSAWGFDPGESNRRGFDSIVQAASGISWIESDGGAPGALPAQVLDHSAGYLLAAGVMSLLRRQRREGGSWLAETSLRRVAAELLTLPRKAEFDHSRTAGGAPSGSKAHTRDYESGAGTVRTAMPAPSYASGPIDFPAAPRPWGRDAADWAKPQ